MQLTCQSLLSDFPHRRKILKNSPLSFWLGPSQAMCGTPVKAKRHDCMPKRHRPILEWHEECHYGIFTHICDEARSFDPTGYP